MWPYTEDEYELFFGLPAETPTDEPTSDERDEVAERVTIWLEEYKAGVMDP